MKDQKNIDIERDLAVLTSKFDTFTNTVVKYDAENRRNIEEVKELIKTFDSRFVSKEQLEITKVELGAKINRVDDRYRLTKTIVYTASGLILTAVGAAVISLVIISVNR